MDRSSFTETVCPGGNPYRALRNLSPQTPVDYMELRSEKPFDGWSSLDGGPRSTQEAVDAGWDVSQFVTVSVVTKEGDVCSGASDPTTCTSTLGRLRVGTGWPTSEYGEEAYGYVAYTRADEVGAVASLDALNEFLAPIDNANEAALLVSIRQFGSILCAGGNNVRAVDGGWEVITESGTTCGTEGISENVVRVSASGEVTKVQSIHVQDGDPDCTYAIGRRPEGLSPFEKLSASSALGAWLAEVAHLEAASVDAFERLALELAAHGAPEELIALAKRSADDERLHARLTAGLAKRHGAETKPPAVPALGVRDLQAIALENAIEGCVRETYGALVATYQASNARDPHIARAMKRIAEDETRHAALSWDVATWLDTKLTDEQRRNVHHTRMIEAASLRGALGIEPDAEVAELAGLPTGAVAQSMFDAAAPQLWGALSTAA